MTQSDFHAWMANPSRRPLVMGILNVTPDSFSDGGRFLDPSTAVDQARTMAAAGASIIDVGGESTRPGSQPITDDEQIRRVVPVISSVAQRIDALISVDTTRTAVARAAIDAGAGVINDISAGRDDSQMLPLATERKVPIILMHMRGTPATMQVDLAYRDVTEEVTRFLKDRIEASVHAGIDRRAILIDPGIGFGKTPRHNLELLRRLGELRTLDCPIVVGTSRKSFIEKITGETLASGRPFGTAATVAWAAANGAGILRVHDVKPMSQVVRMIEAIETMPAERADFPANQ